MAHAVVRGRRREEPVVTRPVVFVHGVRTSSAIWSAQVEAVRAQGHRTVAVDLPGHGARSAERFTAEGAMRAIDEAVTGCATPPLLVGLSLGGYTSLAYAARRQSSLAGVVLAGCSTELRGKPLSAYRHVAHHATRRLRIGGDSWHIVTDMLSTLSGYSSMADLRRLRLPVWFVNGRSDPLRVDEWRFLLARPGARLTVVPGAGHDVNSDAPGAFNRVLLDALELVRTTAGTATGALPAGGAVRAVRSLHGRRVPVFPGRRRPALGASSWSPPMPA